MEEQTPQERLKAAGAAWDRTVRTLPEGLRVDLPPHIEVAAGQDALIRMLVAAGLIDEREFVEKKILRLAEIVEQNVEQLKQAKRQMSGLVIPSQMPQGGKSVTTP